MKKALIIVIILLLVLGAFPVALYYAANPSTAAAAFAQSLAGKTDRQLVIKGKTSFSIVPTPHFTFEDIILREPAPVSSLLPAAYTIAEVKAYPGLFSLFSKTPEIKKLVLVRPVAKLRLT